MRMITTFEARRNFSKLLKLVASGESVNITKNGEIVATLIPAVKSLKPLHKSTNNHFDQLISRKPFAHVTERGTRDELYEDDKGAA